MPTLTCPLPCGVSEVYGEDLEGTDGKGLKMGDQGTSLAVPTAHHTAWAARTAAPAGLEQSTTAS